MLGTQVGLLVQKVIVMFLTILVDEEEMEDDDEDDDGVIHTVVYFWQVPADYSPCLCHVTMVTVGTGC